MVGGVLATRSGSRPGRSLRCPHPAVLYLVGLALVWVGGTLLFSRNKIFAALPVAVAAGGTGWLIAWLGVGGY